MNTEPLMTTAEIARAIGVSNPTINRWRTLGIIDPTVSIGGTIRWTLAEVIQGLRDHHESIPKRYNPSCEKRRVSK
jgi:predicted site-specific integrase-resolvase